MSKSKKQDFDLFIGFWIKDYPYAWISGSTPEECKRIYPFLVHIVPTYNVDGIRHYYNNKISNFSAKDPGLSILNIKQSESECKMVRNCFLVDLLVRSYDMDDFFKIYKNMEIRIEGKKVNEPEASKSYRRLMVQQRPPFTLHIIDVESKYDKKYIPPEDEFRYKPKKVSISVSTPFLTNDVLDIIMKKSDIKTINNMCKINKFLLNKCNTDVNFWKIIFYRDNIPFLMKKTPMLVKKWIKHYNLINLAQNTATKFINQNISVLKYHDENNFANEDEEPQLEWYAILTKNKIIRLYGGEISYSEESVIPLIEMTWLPSDVIQKYKNTPRKFTPHISFSVIMKGENNFVFEIATKVDEKSKHNLLKFVGKDEFIYNFTNLFYYYPDMIIIDDIYQSFTYKELKAKKPSKNLKRWLHIR